MRLARFSLAVLGGVTVTVAAILIAVSVGLFTFIGGADTIEIPSVRVTPVEGRIDADDIAFFFDQGRFVPDVGTARLTIRNPDGTPLFAGVTDQLTADRFIDGDPRRYGIWLATAEGASADLAWDLQGDDWVFVVSNADGTVPAQVVVGGSLAASPFRLAASTVAGLGVATGVAGGLLLLAAARLGRRRPDHTVPPSRVPVAAGV
ncbi:MAG: hypothetical protein ACLGHX_07205 [Acidimicrobiia bacterium]